MVRVWYDELIHLMRYHPAVGILLDIPRVTYYSLIINLPLSLEHFYSTCPRSTYDIYHTWDKLLARREKGALLNGVPHNQFPS